LPNEHYFPYDTLEAKAALPDRWPTSPSVPQSTRTDNEAANSAKSRPESHVLVPHRTTTSDIARKIDLTTALQYGTAQGYPALFGFIKQFTTKHLHPTVPYLGGVDIILTCGSTDGLSKVVQCFNNEWSEETGRIEEREGLLVEEFAYMNAVQTAKPRGMTITPVAMDDQGMLASGPGGLEHVLKNWNFATGKRPHLLYTVT
jgi:DNA-binding transcriptional MocR family regulator